MNCGLNGTITHDAQVRARPAAAADLGLYTDQFRDDLGKHAGAARVAEDVDSADLSRVSGTPTFFINGIRHYGAYDIATLTAAVKAARAQATIKA